jgi:hypothetical protein
MVLACLLGTINLDIHPIENDAVVDNPVNVLYLVK